MHSLSQPGPPRRYPNAPVVGVGGVVINGHEVLLIKRGNAPAKGIWSIPGGALELGETLAGGLAREILEETGLEVKVGPLIEVVERLLPDESGKFEYHYVLIDYLCLAGGGEPEAGDDAADARWVALDELDQAGLTDDTARVIKKGFAILKNLPQPLFVKPELEQNSGESEQGAS